MASTFLGYGEIRLDHNNCKALGIVLAYLLSIVFAWHYRLSISDNKFKITNVILFSLSFSVESIKNFPL